MGKDMPAANPDKKTPRLVAMIVFNGAEILDIAGPASVFSKANIWSPGAYEFRVLGPSADKIIDGTGIGITPHASWRNHPRQCIDTLMIAGGNPDEVLRELQDGELAAWIASAAPRVRRIASVCTGAFALAQAGLLCDRFATTHWSSIDLFRQRFPETKVVDDEIYVRDGNIWSSAGVLTGIDLALALVEEDLGRACALEIGSQLVLGGIRPGNSPQKSALLASQAQASHPIRELLSWMHLNLTCVLTAQTLAERMGMSERHFRRIFQSETGLTPAKYVATARLNHAASLLRSTTWNIEAVANRSGFESVSTMQRGFSQRWGVSPAEYRQIPATEATLLK